MSLVSEFASRVNFGFELARLAYDDIVADLSQTQHRTRVHVHLGRLALDTSKRFMDPDGSMRQRKTLAPAPAVNRRAPALAAMPV
jgi:hypothetical protein